MGGWIAEEVDLQETRRKINAQISNGLDRRTQLYLNNARIVCTTKTTNRAKPKCLLKLDM
jgi:hypothetical protein